ncbi:DegT/DnrJ/EryC1/StrS family aminotransferase [Amycolatopsis magusensis]|uniref:dTDP-4-amino-4,6-dideoxygalactose transaminase n=1 Tax=Amycolatopsis magusensis TaxID=882444 RepID=A0ABS4PZK5_9PSEU|nr:DegT/DnrJ/EryC1/StrS family aminotransferase [Amycolatopsis magusensis]MBP2184861.1 dTDP-4-amino-4,6-dideoxygalactose transaminase [Amycolatopsis magusensis]
MAAGGLAVLGGPQLIPGGIDESVWPEVDESDLDAVTGTLRSGKLSWFNNVEVKALEEQWARYAGTKHCLALNSGTAALHAAVAAVGVGPGDEVVVPALSFLASASCVLHHQGIPVFADIDPVTFTLDPAELERVVTPRTKAIIVVHLHGLPADMAPILDFAGRHGLAVIEDAAQAHGATYRGRAVGSLGSVGAFSIMAGKNLPTAGEGGLLTTDDAELRNRADAVKMFGEQIGPDNEREYNAHTIGFNYRMSPILAAMARSQLARLDRYTKEVQAGAERLAARLSELPGVRPPVVPADRTHVYHHFRITLDPEAAGVDLPPGVFRQAVQNAVAAEGAPVSMWQNRPLPGQALFRDLTGYGKGCPWTCGHARPVRYRQEEFPHTLAVIQRTLLAGTRLCMASLRDPASVEAYADAFTKVMTHRDALVTYARGLDYAEPWETASRLW